MTARYAAGGAGTVIRPFFPGYLLVWLDLARGQWCRLRYSRGVRAVLQFGDERDPVPDGAVEGLTARESYGGIRPPPASERLRVGQQVSLHGTLFDAFLCTVESINTKDRVCVLLELMQQTVRMVVPSEVVTAA